MWKHALFAPLFFNPSGLNVGRPGWLFLNRAGGFKIKTGPVRAAAGRCREDSVFSQKKKEGNKTYV